VALGAVGGGVWLLYQRAESAPEIGKAQLDQLREGMSADEVHAILGNPQTRHTDAGTTRETQVDRVSEAKYFEYFRKGTLMLVFNADQQLIEVCVGEDSSEYYKRKAGEKVLWQSYPATGFIHQDVAQPVFQT